MASKTFAATCTGDTSVSRTWTSLTLTETYDPSGWHSDSTNPTRITVDETGWYMMLGIAQMRDAWDHYSRWLVNGTTAHSQMGEGGAVSAAFRAPESLYMACLTAGDYVEFQYNMQDSGTTVYATVVMIRLPTPLFVGYATSGGSGSAIALTESLDNGNWHSDSTNPTRVTVDTTGNYLYLSYVAISNSQNFSYVLVNGTAVHSGQHVPNFGSPGGGQVMCGVLSLTAGDYVELYSSGSVTDCQMGLAYIPGVKCAMATQASRQTIPGSPTDVQFDSETVDTSGFHSTSTNPERMTIPSDGTYLSLGSVRLQGFISLFSQHLKTSPSTYVIGGEKCTVQSTGAFGSQQSQAATVWVQSYTASDYTKFQAWHDSGGTYLTDSPGTSLAIVCTDDFVYGVGCPNLIASSGQIYRRL